MPQTGILRFLEPKKRFRAPRAKPTAMALVAPVGVAIGDDSEGEKTFSFPMNWIGELREFPIPEEPAQTNLPETSGQHVGPLGERTLSAKKIGHPHGKLITPKVSLVPRHTRLLPHVLAGQVFNSF